MELSEEDVRLITLYVNTLNTDDALKYIQENDCFAEQAWLEHAAEQAAIAWNITVMTAYASARGDVTSFTLRLPDVG